MKNNDDKVMLLKQTIQDKKKSISTKRFNPVTNCMLPGILGGVTVNINTLDINMLKIYKNILKNIIKDENLMIGIYAVSDWINDIDGRIDYLTNQSKLTDLRNLEIKLSTLLSSEAKVSLEIAEVEHLLGTL